MKIIGISGTNGSGKDTIGSLLADKHGFLFVSVTDLLRDECRKRGLSVERLHLRTISAEWRRNHGLGVLVDKAVQTYQSTHGNYRGLAIASLRNPGEADCIHEQGGTVIWVDADPAIRFKRIQNVPRGRAAEDNKTYQEFLAEEGAEMQHGGDEATLNMAAVKAKSDYRILNESDQAALELAVSRVLKSM